MSVYVAEANGHYLGWYAVVSAADEDEALELASNAWIEDVGRNGDKAGDIEVKQLEAAGVHVLFNGDY